MVKSLTPITNLPSPLLPPCTLGLCWLVLGKGCGSLTAGVGVVAVLVVAAGGLQAANGGCLEGLRAPGDFCPSMIPR